MKLVITPITTEKSTSVIETQNKMTFTVEKNATKEEIKKEIEKDYGFAVQKVTITNTPKNQKKATVKFEKQGAAADLAAKFKLI